MNQTFKDFEIIIVNDGSTDNGLEKIKKFTDNRIKIFQQENQGVSVARNKGMEMAEGEYFCFLDADDEWKNDCLENFYKAIVRFSDYLVFSAAIEIETKKKQSLRNMLLLILLMIAISLRIFLKQVLNFP